MAALATVAKKVWSARRLLVLLLAPLALLPVVFALPPKVTPRPPGAPRPARPPARPRGPRPDRFRQNPPPPPLDPLPLGPAPSGPFPAAPWSRSPAQPSGWFPRLPERVLFAGLGARGAGLNASLDDPSELFTKAKLKGLGRVT